MWYGPTMSMKRMILAVIAASLTFVLPVPAQAADLSNRDKKAYKFKFVDGSVTSNRKISAGGAIYGLCTPNSKCKIILNGVTSFEFDSNARLKIEGGKVMPQ